MLAFSLPFTTSKAGQSALPTLFTPTLFFIAMLLFGRGVEGQGWVMPMNLAAVIARIDPIVNPGGVANHVHNIVGGSGISKDLDISALANSDCSTSPLQADKSAYWAPQLYYRYPDNTLAPLMGNSRIYYFIKEDQQDVKPFPPGFRMISGNQGASRTPNSYESRGVQISCAGNARTPYMPNNTRGACGSISMGIFFPSCGLADGSLDSDDHFSHMAWPITNLGGGATQRPEPNSGYCPPSHPIKYPTIFLEHNYYLREGQPWRKEDNLLVLSNGDTVGTSYHADFVNGWDQDVLTRAIKECRVGDNLAACSVFKPSYDVAASQKCRMKQQVPSESVGLVTKLDKLPGCNPLWPASAGDEKPGCDNAPATPGFVWPNAIFNNLMYRWGIPAVVPQAKVVPGNGRQTVAMWDALAPSYMGAQGQSSVRGFGTGGSSIADIVAAWVNSDGTKGFNLGGNGTASASASASKSSASASKSASASASKSASASASKSAAASASKSASVTASIRLQSSSAAKTTAKSTASTAKASSASATKSASKSAASASASPESYDDGEYHCVRKTNAKRGVDAHKAKRRLNLKTRNHKARLLEEE